MTRTVAVPVVERLGALMASGHAKYTGTPGV